MDRKDPIYLDALAKWGPIPQMRQAQEECAELIVSVNHLIRGRDGAEEGLIEEIADCFIILNQLSCYFGHDKIDSVISRKIERLRQRVKELPK